MPKSPDRPTRTGVSIHALTSEATQLRWKMRQKSNTRMQLETGLSTQEFIAKYAGIEPPDLSDIIEAHLELIERIAHARWAKLKTTHPISRQTRSEIEEMLKDAHDARRSIGTFSYDHMHGLDGEVMTSLELYEEVISIIGSLEKSADNQ